MNLSELIMPLLDISDEQIIELLNAKTVARIDSSLWTWSGLLRMFGKTACDGMYQALGLGPVAFALGGKGIDFSLDQTQQDLEESRPLLGDAVDALKAIGRWSVSPYQDAGFTGVVTIDQVAAARPAAAVLQQEQDVYDWWDLIDKSARQQIRDGASQSDIRTLAEGS